MDPQRLEGLVLRQALCERCGYQFGGVAIKDGRIRCPECGGETDFVQPLLATGETSEPPVVWRRVLRLVGLIVLGASVVAVVVARLM